jgi:lipopolysaccharide export system permease protein
MLFDSSLKQELNRSFGATLVVLVTVVMTMVLIRTLGLASNGNVNPAEVSLVLGFTVLGYLPTIFTLSLFVAMVSTLSRLYRDSEMVIWLTSGQGLMQLLRPMWRFSWPLILIVAALILWVWPWSNQQIQELRERYEKRGDLERVTPGQFQSSASGQRVFFIEKDQAGDLQGKNVFISITDADKTVIATARTGRIDMRDDERFLVLENGQRLERRHASQELTLAEFETYATRISRTLVDPSQLSAKMLPLDALLTQPNLENQAELVWRLGSIFACFNFVLLALLMAQFNPRSGRSLQLMLALFSFLVYTNMINIGKTWVVNHKVTPLGFALALHGGLLVVALAGVWMRHQQWSWRHWLPARTFAGAKP